MVLTHLRSAYGWLSSQVHRPHAPYVLGLLFYIEAIFFIPTEPILAIYVSERKDRLYFFTAIATIASVLGGVTGYLIGLYAWQAVGASLIHHPFVNFFITAQRFNYLADLFAHYEWAALLIAGIPPIPYKAVTLAAGFCRVPLLPFILCSCIIRGIRFYLVSYFVAHVGPELRTKFEKERSLIIIKTMMVFIVATIIYLLVKR